MPPSFAVTGGRPLKGTIRPAGNKNAALPILAATLLADAPCRIDNVPRIGDVETMLALLAHLGAEVRWTGDHAVEIDPAHAAPRELDPALCARIRASILLAGPMLARFGRVALPPPGGDVIGRRRVDTHLLALEQMGAEITVGDNYKFGAPARGLRPADIFLDEPSVTASENVLMAAAATPGTTVLRNAASEPHVQDLARFLTGLGAQIEGIGTNTLTVRGGKLRGAAGVVGPDHIEIGSVIGLAAATNGALTIDGVRAEGLRGTPPALDPAGARPPPRGDRRAVAAAWPGRGQPRHPGRYGDVARRARGARRLGDPQHRPDRAGVRADRRAAEGARGGDRARGRRRQRRQRRQRGEHVSDSSAARAASATPAALRETEVGDPSVPRLELREWAERYDLVAGITTREHGFSLGLWSEENVGQVMTRWRAFRAAFQPAFPVTVLSHQIHGSAVRW